MAIQMSDGQLYTIYKSILSFFSKCVYEQYLQSLNKRNSLLQKSKINVSVMFQIYVTMASKHQTIGNFTLKSYFQNNLSTLSKPAS